MIMHSNTGCPPVNIIFYTSIHILSILQYDIEVRGCYVYQYMVVSGSGVRGCSLPVMLPAHKYQAHVWKLLYIKLTICQGEQMNSVYE